MKESKMEVYIQTAIMKSALEIASKEETRYYMKGVHFECLGKNFDIVATDGTALIAFKNRDDQIDDDDYDGLKFTIPSDIVKLAIQATGKAAAMPLKVWLDGQVICYSLAGIPFQPIDGQYPAWRRVFPESLTHTVQQFDLKNLMKFEKIGRFLKKNVHISHNDGPCLVTFNDENITGLIMPFNFKSYSPDAKHHIEMFSDRDFTDVKFQQKESA
jgi:DNA polymerase-3 subunit beta